jgi:hypothetical protein
MMRVGEHEVEVRAQVRKSLALRATPGGLVALIPKALDLESDVVRAFIERALRRLPEPAQVAFPMTDDELRALVELWAKRVEVQVTRIQIRTMRNKWASCSSQGTITLNSNVLSLPREVVDYILVHELLHVKFPGHGKGWQAMMSVYVPGWRELERRLAGWGVR